MKLEVRVRALPPGCYGPVYFVTCPTCKVELSGGQLLSFADDVGGHACLGPAAVSRILAAEPALKAALQRPGGLAEGQPSFRTVEV